MNAQTNPQPNSEPRFQPQSDEELDQISSSRMISRGIAFTLLLKKYYLDPVIQTRRLNKMLAEVSHSNTTPSGTPLSERLELGVRQLLSAMEVSTKGERGSQVIKEIKAIVAAAADMRKGVYHYE